jgi:hypothetical protein
LSDGAASITGDNFMLMQGRLHHGTVSYAGNTLTFNPSVDLEGGALFTATVLLSRGCRR